MYMYIYIYIYIYAYVHIHISYSKHVSTVMDRSSCLEVFCKIGVLKNFAKLIAKHLCQGFFFNINAGMRPTSLFEKSL